MIRPFLRSVPLILAVALAFAGCSAEARKERLLDRAANYYREGEFEKAKVEYLNVAQLDPTHGIAQERLGLIWLAQGSPVRALPYLEKLRTRSPSNLEAREALVATYLSLAKVTDARHEAEAILDRDGSRGAALIALATTIRHPSEYEAVQQRLARCTDKSSAEFLVASAHVALVAGNRAAAKTALDRALRAAPESSAVQSGLAAWHLAGSEAAAATVALKRAADLPPARSPEKLRYAEARWHAGAVTEAHDYLTEKLRVAPDFLAARALLARIAFAEHDYPRARSTLNPVLQRDPWQLDAQLLDADLLEIEGQRARAVDNLSALLKVLPRFGALHHRLARLHLAAGQLGPAVAVLQQGAGADADCIDNVLLLAQLNLASGKADEAAKAMATLLRGRPATIDAQVLLIDALSALGRLDDAAAIAIEQARVAPDRAYPHHFLGKIRRVQTRPDDARASFNRALVLEPEFWPALGELVDLALAAGKPAEALARVEPERTAHPNQAELHYLAARSFAALDRWPDANHAIVRAVELNAELVGCYDLLLLSTASGQVDAPTVTALETLLTARPHDDRLLHALALIHTQAGNTAAAQTLYERLLGLKPDAAVALNNLASLYASDPSRLTAAHELATRARRLEPTSPIVADTLGWIAYLRRDFDAARALLTESAAGLGDNPEVQFHLGMASRQCGDDLTARRALRAAASAPVHFAGQEQARDELARLERGEKPVALSSTTEPR